MKMVALTIVTCWLMGTAALAEKGDVVVDPQVGVGPIRFQMLEADIRKLGPIEEHYYFYHGKAWGDTSVWPDDPLIRVKAVFSDPPDDRPAFIVVSGYGSKYVLPNGLRLGSSLELLEKLNGRPFAFRGMAQDDAGEVLSWCGGNLEKSMPRIKLFFHPLPGWSEREEVALDQVCAPITYSNDPIWKQVHVEVGKIQIARPDGPLAPSGPEYGPAEVVEATAPPTALESLLHDPKAHNSYYPFAQGRYAVLLETPPDDGSYSARTTLSLLRVTHEGIERIQEHEMEYTWEPPRPLTIISASEGGPEADLFVADSGALLSAYRLVGEQSLKAYTFPLIRSDQLLPAYQMVRNSHGRLEIHQLWELDGILIPGPVDYTWNGEHFLFPDGSKVSQ